MNLPHLNTPCPVSHTLNSRRHKRRDSNGDRGTGLAFCRIADWAIRVKSAGRMTRVYRLTHYAPLMNLLAAACSPRSQVLTRHEFGSVELATTVAKHLLNSQSWQREAARLALTISFPVEGKAGSGDKFCVGA